MDRRRYLASVAAVTVAAGCATGRQNSSAPGQIVVDPEGTDAASGSQDAPLRTIQEGLRRADPGDTVHVNPGEYFEAPRTTRSGTASDPITITGPPEAILRGPRTDGYSGGLRITHSHVHVRGLTIDGLQDPANPRNPESYMNIGIHTLPVDMVYLEDLVFKPHAIGNTRGAMITLNYVEGVEIGEFRLIGPAGVDYMLGAKEGHFGEVVYVGSTPDAEFNAIDREGEIAGVDRTNDVYVHHIDGSAGHYHIELVDCKVGSHDVLVEYCTSVDAGLPSDNDNSSAVHIGGHDITFRWNRVLSPAFNGIDVGNYGPFNDNVPHPDAPKAASENAIYGNELTGAGELAINYTEETSESAQRVVCGNVIDTETEGEPGVACPDELPSGVGVGHTGGDSPWA